MFICKMCKKTFEGSPAFVNGVGTFCAECKSIIHARAAEAAKNNWDGKCGWCGNEVSRQYNGGDRRTVCVSCENHRAWLLRCIRHSDKPFKYVTDVETRENPLREERRLKKLESQKSVDVAAPTPEPAVDTKRLDRMERLICQIAEGLGLKA